MYVGLEEEVFSRAAQDAQPPKKDKHRLYLGSGRDPDFVRQDLTNQMADIICMAKGVLPGLV